ncbi:MAG TPA: sulfite exporter TauE/SafE family protein [Terriglobales bacterium]|nr:sulfite exporter TauE/SafE family protein [Terriglobales bacterium]
MSAAREVILVAIGFFAGLIGALSGIGGGIIITPVLSIYFGIPLVQAIGTSLVAVITTSTASSAVHVQRHTTDIKLGLTLELATALGAAIMAYLAIYVNRSIVAVLFTFFLLYSAFTLLRRIWKTRGISTKKPDNGALPAYAPKRYPAGLAASLVAGGVSGLLGIGGGPIKVPVMYLLMEVPLNVATATSNFMIGVTASASAFVYFRRGDVMPTVAGPLVVGVFAGSLLGAKAAPKVQAKHIVLLLVVIMLVLAVQMLIKVVGGKFA